jgi:hypothetical protein
MGQRFETFRALNQELAENHRLRDPNGFNGFLSIKFSRSATPGDAMAGD